MGRKAGTLFINPKRFGSLHKPCMKEMAMFLNCMAANHSDSEACARQKELLNACMDSQSKKNRKSWGVSIINCRGLAEEGSNSRF
ncbi:hypothetical protein E2542_SST16805 [Spatholobus suberectus]|nr:hypothetical protein E2542_SST16805 [Spatholobus suberectus]